MSALVFPLVWLLVIVDSASIPNLYSQRTRAGRKSSVYSYTGGNSQTPAGTSLSNLGTAIASNDDSAGGISSEDSDNMSEQSDDRRETIDARDSVDNDVDNDVKKDNSEEKFDVSGGNYHYSSRDDSANDKSDENIYDKGFLKTRRPTNIQSEQFFSDNSDENGDDKQNNKGSNESVDDTDVTKDVDSSEPENDESKQQGLRNDNDEDTSTEDAITNLRTWLKDFSDKISENTEDNDAKLDQYLTQISRMRGLLDTIGSKIATSQVLQSGGSCPRYPVHVSSDKVTVTTQKGCKIVIKLDKIGTEDSRDIGINRLLHGATEVSYIDED